MEVLEATVASERSKGYLQSFYDRLNPKASTQASTSSAVVTAPISQTIQIKLSGQTAFRDFELPTTQGVRQTFKTAKTLVNYIPFKSVGTYSTLAKFCAVAGTAGLESPNFDPLFLKGSTLAIYNIPENKRTEITPTFEYFEVAANGEITSKAAAEPSAVAISGTACTNFAVGVYLKYKMSKEGVPTAATFSVYYKTTETFASTNIIAS